MLPPCQIAVETQKPRYEVADVLRRYFEQYRQENRVSRYEERVVDALMKCRTAALGGYVKQCNGCGKYVIGYCSCKNRHCPKCGAFEKAQWLAKTEQLLLPTHYFHVVFTIDHAINAVMWANKRVMYNWLFQAAWQVLQEFGRRYLRGEIGVTMVLHTWGQTMQQHAHLHCIVTGGALVLSGEAPRWQSSPSKRFLFPVVALSAEFRKIFCDGVEKLWQQKQLWAPTEEEMSRDSWNVPNILKGMRSQKWEVFIERPKKEIPPERLLDYLGKYIYRIAIANYRIKAIGKGKVAFDYYNNRKRDKDGQGQLERAVLNADTFIKRFLQHLLPPRFQRVRHYGLHHSSCRHKLQLCRLLMGLPKEMPEMPALEMEQWLRDVLEDEPNRCPFCHRGRLEKIQTFASPSPIVLALWSLLGIPLLGEVEQ